MLRPSSLSSTYEASYAHAYAYACVMLTPMLSAWVDSENQV